MPKPEGQIVAERVNVWAKGTGLMGSRGYLAVLLMMDLTPEERAHAKMCVGIMQDIELGLQINQPENAVIITSVY